MKIVKKKKCDTTSPQLHSICHTQGERSPHFQELLELLHYKALRGTKTIHVKLGERGVLAPAYAPTPPLTHLKRILKNSKCLLICLFFDMFAHEMSSMKRCLHCTTRILERSLLTTTLKWQETNVKSIKSKKGFLFAYIFLQLTKTSQPLRSCKWLEGQQTAPLKRLSSSKKQARTWILV